jgi:prepilin-type N-terminal cleavage/methylation domain-containing protein
MFRALAGDDRPRKTMVCPTAGVTLIEMLVVVAVIGIVVGVSMPSISAGLDSVRLASTGDAIASFLNGAVTHAERSEYPVVVVISLKDGTISADGSDGFTRRFQVPQGITMDKLLPEGGGSEEGDRQLLIVPGGTAPAIGVEYSNRHGGRRRVQLDPMTGFPRVETVNTE